MTIHLHLSAATTAAADQSLAAVSREVDAIIAAGPPQSPDLLTALLEIGERITDAAERIFPDADPHFAYATISTEFARRLVVNHRA